MAYVQSVKLVDTDRRTVVKLVNSGTTESSNVAVNAAALNFALTTITTAASTNNFQIGETINSSSGGSAVVQDVVNSTTIVVYSTSGTLADADTLTGNLTAKTRVQSGSVAPQAYALQISRILYNVSGNASAAQVELIWEGASGGANNRTVMLLSGAGEYRLDDHAMVITNNANNATGNILVNTLNWSGTCGYSLVLDIKKESGYNKGNIQRNRDLGYGGNF